jgi:hypothetical protein
MQLKIPKTKNNIIDLLRSAGYSYRGMNNGDFGFIKRIGLNEYPHYHIYARVENNNVVMNLHLDQKKPSYEGSAAHGGEYDGELVEKEMERIKLLITNN